MREFLSGGNGIMALQRQPQLRKQHGYPVWVWLLLLLTPTALEIFDVANMIRRPWTTVLNTVLIGVKAILILLQGSAQTLAETHPLPVFRLPVSQRNEQRRRCKNATRAISSHQKEQKVIQHLVPSFQDTALSIKAVSRKAKRNLPFERVEIMPTKRRPYVSLLMAPVSPLSKTAA